MLPRLDIEALKKLAVDTRLWAEWSTRAVVAGLFLELLVEFLYTKDKPWHEIVLSVLAVIVIAVGVYGELHFGATGAQANATLQRDSDERVAQANERASDADKDAANARKAAEDERTARLEFERLYGPRRLTKAQVRDLIKTWR